MENVEVPPSRSCTSTLVYPDPCHHDISPSLEEYVRANAYPDSTPTIKPILSNPRNIHIPRYHRLSVGTGAHSHHPILVPCSYVPFRSSWLHTVSWFLVHSLVHCVRLSGPPVPSEFPVQLNCRNCQTVSPPGLESPPFVRGVPFPLLLTPQTGRRTCSTIKDSRVVRPSVPRNVDISRV